MLNICWRYHYGMLRQLSTLPTDMEGATAFENIVNLIGAGMRVRLLLLARLKTVEITEHALGLKQVHFLHLLLIKSLLTEDIFGIHTVLHLCSRLHTRSSDSTQRGIVANLSPAVYACRILGSRWSMSPTALWRVILGNRRLRSSLPASETPRRAKRFVAVTGSITPRKLTHSSVR